MKIGYVYILTNSLRTVLYVGVTSDLKNRVWSHKNRLVDGSTKEYKVDRLIYFEAVGEMEYAIKREKQLKRWRRMWKEELITSMNPEWRDLFDEIDGY